MSKKEETIRYIWNNPRIIYKMLSMPVHSLPMDVSLKNVNKPNMLSGCFYDFNWESVITSGLCLQFFANHFFASDKRNVYRYFFANLSFFAVTKLWRETK